MADVRINGKRWLNFKSESKLNILIRKIEIIAEKNNHVLTGIKINHVSVDFESFLGCEKILSSEDIIEVKLDSSSRLSYESLHQAIDLADLLIVDIKKTIVRLWKSGVEYLKELDQLLDDCHLFLSLAAKPVYLLGYKLFDLPQECRLCLMELDKIAGNLKDATLLAAHGYGRQSSLIMIKNIYSSVEKWLGQSAIFAQRLSINTQLFSAIAEEKVLT